MRTAISRVFEITQCRTQCDLAQMLGIRQSSISEAKRRGNVPAEWLVTLLRAQGVNPEWIITGNGPKFLNQHPEHSNGMTAPAEDGHGWSAAGETRQAMLRRFSAQDLADELVRRAMQQTR